MGIIKKIWRVIQNKTKIQVKAGKAGAIRRQKIPGLGLGFYVLVLVFKSSADLNHRNQHKMHWLILFSFFGGKKSF